MSHSSAVRRLYGLEPDVVGNRGQSLNVGAVAGENGATGFGQSNDKCVDRRTSASSTPKLGGASCGPFAHDRFDDAHFQESIGVCIAPRVSLQRFDENHAGHDGWPQLLIGKGLNQRSSGFRSSGQARESATVEDEQGSARLVECATSNAPRNHFGFGTQAGTGFADVSFELGEVELGLGDCILAFDLGSKRALKQFGRGQSSAFEGCDTQIRALNVRRQTMSARSTRWVRCRVG